MLSFLQYMAHKDHLNHLKHKLKSPLSDEERQNTYDEIEKTTKVLMHHLSLLQPGISEDAGVAAGVASAGPTNVVSSGAIAGTGGKGGEPGVYLKKKKSPIVLPMGRRKPPKV